MGAAASRELPREVLEMMVDERNIPTGLDSHDANVPAAAKARSERDANILSHCKVVRRIAEWKTNVVAGFDDAQRPEIEKFGDDARTLPRGQKPLYRSLVWTQLINTAKYCFEKILPDWPHMLPDVPVFSSQNYHQERNNYIVHLTVEFARQIYHELGPAELGPHRGVFNVVPQHAEQMRADGDAVGLALTKCPMQYSPNGVWTAEAMAQWLTTHPRVLELQAKVLDLYQAQLDESILHCKECEEAVEFTSTEYRKVFLMGAMFNQLSIEPPMDEDVQV